MQAPPPKTPKKERRFLPGMNARSFPARFSVASLSPGHATGTCK